MSKHRNYVFTWNNWNTESIEKLKETFTKEITSFICWGEEIGEEGTPHLQGYLELNAPRPITFLCGTTKKPKWLYGTRLDKRKGNQIEAINYCKKGDQSKEEWEESKSNGPNFGLNAKYTELGIKNKQGSRTDIDGIKEAAIRGGMKEVTNIASNIQQVKLAEIFLRYHEPKRTEMPTIYWLHGPTNVGKSHWARQIALSHGYTEEDIFDKDESKWFLDYDCHKCTIFNDYRGCIKFCELLKICDKWAHSVECKGGSRQFNSPLIIFTSDRAPENCYRNVGDVNQLIRRIESKGKVILLTERCYELPIRDKIIYLNDEGIYSHNAPAAPPHVKASGGLAGASLLESSGAASGAASPAVELDEEFPPALPSVPWTPEVPSKQRIHISAFAQDKDEEPQYLRNKLEEIQQAMKQCRTTTYKNCKCLTDKGCLHK